MREKKSETFLPFTGQTILESEVIKSDGPTFYPASETPFFSHRTNSYVTLPGKASSQRCSTISSNHKLSKAKHTYQRTECTNTGKIYIYIKQSHYDLYRSHQGTSKGFLCLHYTRCYVCSCKMNQSHSKGLLTWTSTLVIETDQVVGAASYSYQTEAVAND